ncbi:MAG: ferrous iron transport protein B [Thiobacillus sp.]|nr:ferrous iron transport protein B [Thiobacillus sp.]
MNPSTGEPRPMLIGLAGQPNVGKSTVFNLLTGLSQHVGNWPGKTVERREGAFLHEDSHVRVVDLPGTYSLTANSPEERIARDFILHEHPDVIVMIADAAALERNLYLLAELLLLPAPVVLGLNMMDVARAEGIEIEPHVLAAALGLPVIPMEASRARGVAELASEAVRLAREPAAFSPSRPEIGEPHRAMLASMRASLGEQVPLPYQTQWVAMKLLEGDREVTALARAWLADEAWEKIAAILAAHEDAVADIAAGRYEWIGRMVRAAVKRPRLGQVSLTDRLDRYALHPFWGLLILLAAFTLVFALTFQIAAPAQAWLDTAVVEALRAWVTEALAGSPPWLTGLLADGVVGGAGIVLTFLPILLMFFIALGLLEDTGYFARAGYVMDRFMHHLGLHGKSFMPLALGFGCNVPAVMGARVIESRSGRLLTILLAPLVPCSARLLVLAFLAAAFFHEQALFVAIGFVIANLVVLAITGVVLSRTLFRGEHMAFIMELPLYHTPNARSIARFAWANTWSFLRKAGSLILFISVLIWALSYFPGTGLEDSYLARFGHGLAPLGNALGLDWRLLVALLASFVVKENAIAALGILYGSAQGAGLADTLAATVPPASALSFIAATMLFIPCAATIAVMRQETGSWGWTLFGVALLLVIALGAAALVYQACRLLGFGLG